MNRRYWIHGCLVAGFHLAQVDDRFGASHPAVSPARPTDPTQPEDWLVPSFRLERASIETSVPGTTVRPGTGELTLTGYDPEVLVRAVAALEQALSSGSR